MFQILHLAGQVVGKIHVFRAHLAAPKKPCIRENISNTFLTHGTYRGMDLAAPVGKYTLSTAQTPRLRETLHESLVPLGRNGINYQFIPENNPKYVIQNNSRFF